MCATPIGPIRRCWARRPAGSGKQAHRYPRRSADPAWGVSRPGLVIYQFGADLFYANAGRFAGEVRDLVEHAPTPVRWLVIDAGALTDVDYSAARTLRALHEELVRTGVRPVLVHAQASLRADLDRHRLTEVIGPDHIVDTLHEALAAIRDAQRPSGLLTSPTTGPALPGKRENP